MVLSFVFFVKQKAAYELRISDWSDVCSSDLSERGRFRTDRDDLRLLVEHHIPAACKLWKLGAGDSIDVAVYAHGGLTDEEAAAKTARIWIPLLHSNRIFPVFLMWETGARKTIANMFEDVTRGEAELAGGDRKSTRTHSSQ